MRAQKYGENIAGRRNGNFINFLFFFHHNLGNEYSVWVNDKVSALLLL